VSATEQESALGRAGSALAARLSPTAVRPDVYGRHQREVWLGAVVIAVMVPFVIHGGYSYNLAINACLYAILAVGFFYQLVLAGQFSFATPTFYAVGAYVYIWSSRHMGGFLVGAVAAAVVTALAAAVVKLLLARSPLVHFAIATLAVGSLGIILLRNWRSFTGGDEGTYGIAPAKIGGYVFNTPTRQYALVVGALLLGVALAILFERSAAQRDTIFVRDMGPVARTVGLQSLRVQVTTFALGAAYMGVAGALYASTAGFVTTVGFDVSIALLVLVMVLVGGVGTVWGSVVGAIFVYYLQNKLLQKWTNYEDLIYAVLILLVILILPGGIASLPSVIRRHVRRTPLRRSTA
jgi:branched-chain amino acid transport system permease protein